MSIATLNALTESTDAVLVAAGKIRDGGSDTARLDYATDLLAGRIENSLITFAPPGAQGFEPLDGAERPESVQDSLTIAASQLSMAAVALAADAQAADTKAGLRQGDQPRRDFDDAVDDLTATNASLKALVAPAATQGFQAATAASADLAAAVKNLTGATESTLNTICTEGAELCERVVKALPEVVPAIQNTWAAIRDALHLDALGDQLSRLAKAALRLVASALGRLAAMMPGTFIAAAKERVQALAARLEDNEPSVTVFGSILDVPGVQRDLGTRLSRDGLDKAKLDRGASQVTALAKQYGKYIGIAANVAAALKVLHSFSGPLLPIVPHFAVATASAHVIVLVTVVAISLDFLDTGTQVGVVRGVRLAILDATQ